MGKSAKQTKNKKISIVEKELTKLIESPTPEWLTKEIYSDYRSQFEKLKEKVHLEFEQFVGDVFKVSPISLKRNRVHNSVNVPVTAELLYNFWKNDMIISPPSTGQDPKQYEEFHVENAGYHAGWQWGHTEDGSDWRNPATLNIVLYPNGQPILETTDFEHRIVGIIGFIIGGVKLKSDEYKLTFSHHKINREIAPGQFVKFIDVNNMTLSDIVTEANKYTDNNSLSVTTHDVLNRYYKTTIDLIILAMYDENQCHIYYKQQNSSSSKTWPQLLHADNRTSNKWLKQFSSIKLQNFTASDDKLHPFFNLFTSKNQVNLQTFMMAHLVTQYVIEGGFVLSTDTRLRLSYINTDGYKSTFNDEIQKSVYEKLNILYDFFSRIPKAVISPQYIQLFLETNKWIEENDKVIFDIEVFAHELNKWIDYEKKHPKLNEDGSKNDQAGTKTKFGQNMAASSIKTYKDAFKHIRNKFLTKYLLNDTTSNNFGVCTKSDRLPRLFSNQTINDSFHKAKGLDIDNITPIDGKPVGGHIISNFELIHMSNEERDDALLLEGVTGGTFNHDKNCRAMSSHHNLRMSVLRLSEYLQIINEPNSVVKAKILEKREYYKNKPILN
jgi:hypothetical protein